MCSLDARSGRPIQASLLERIRASLERPLGVVRPVLKKIECCFRVMLRIEGDIETGLCQCEAKQLAFAGAVFDQEDGGVRHHIYVRTSAGIVSGSMMKSEMME